MSYCRCICRDPLGNAYAEYDCNTMEEWEDAWEDCHTYAEDAGIELECGEG